MTLNKKNQIKERDGNKCVVCNSREQLTVDHIVPLSAGGTNERSNLRTLCKGCNFMKANKPPRYKAWLNLFFSRKTIYEFKNEIKSEMSARDGVVLAESIKQTEELLKAQRETIGNLTAAIAEQQGTHAKQLRLLAERIRGLQTYLKIEWREEKLGDEWLEEPVIFKGYNKVKKAA